MEIKHFGSSLPSGYVVNIHSWENDGDNWKEIAVYGLTKKQAKFYKKLFSKFACENVKKSGIGNKEFYIEEFVSILAGMNSKYNEEIKNTFGFDLTGIDEDDEDKLYEFIETSVNKIELIKIIYEFIGYPDEMQFQSNFMRAVDKIDVYYIENEIVLPSLKKVKL